MQHLFRAVEAKRSARIERRSCPRTRLDRPRDRARGLTHRKLVAKCASAFLSVLPASPDASVWIADGALKLRATFSQGGSVFIDVLACSKLPRASRSLRRDRRGSACDPRHSATPLDLRNGNIGRMSGVNRVATARSARCDAACTKLVTLHRRPGDCELVTVTLIARRDQSDSPRLTSGARTRNAQNRVWTFKKGNARVFDVGPP